MMCPMRSGSNGGTWDCKETACAWWNKGVKKCAIAILAESAKAIENKRVQTINIEKEWGKDI